MKFIVLNGTTSSGKSTISHAIQTISPDYLHVSLDMFLNMLSPVAINDEAMFKKMLGSVYQPVNALLNNKQNIVFDTVCMDDENTAMQLAFAPSNPFYVKVEAPLEIVKQREITRGDRMIGLSESQFDRVHSNLNYDYAVNTAILTAKQAAEQILSVYTDRLLKPL